MTHNLDHFRIIFIERMFSFSRINSSKKKKKKIKNKEQQKQLHYRNERSELQGKRAGTKTLENKYL